MHLRRGANDPAVRRCRAALPRLHLRSVVGCGATSRRASTP